MVANPDNLTSSEVYRIKKVLVLLNDAYVFGR